MPDIQASAKAQVTPATTDTLLGLVGTAVKRFSISALPFLASGSGAVERPLRVVIGEMQCSILNFGADPTGTSACDIALASALASGAKTIHFPAGIYRFNNTIVIDKSVTIKGDGRNSTFLRSYVSGNNHGMRIIGEAVLGRSNLIKLTAFDFEYMGAGQTASSYWCGVFIQRKVDIDDMYVHGFTNDGILFAPSNADVASGLKGTISNAPFFCYLKNVWSKDNGRDGCWIRMGANANTFENCQFDRNGRYGFRHFNDSPDDNAATASTYGNKLKSGQASYNKQYGFFFENGTNILTDALYAEYNGSTDNTDTNGYVNTQYDFYLGDNCVRSWIGIGVVFGANLSHVRVPSVNSNQIQVWEGGRKIFGDT